jgi:uncharacterized membrane protein
MEHIHPMVVHFPIALLFTSLFLDLLGLLTKKDSFESSAYQLLLLGVLGGVAAIGFGILAEEFVVKSSIVNEAIETHETFAIATVVLFTFLLAARYFFDRKENFKTIRSYYLITAFLGIVLLAATAYYGGQLVYEYRLAVSLT